jgi:hypothetical protein
MRSPALHPVVIPQTLNIAVIHPMLSFILSFCRIAMDHEWSEGSPKP